MPAKFENPYFDKLVGISHKQEDLEQQLHEYVIDNVENVGGKKIADFEIPKTQKDIEIINFIEKEADKILKSYGREKRISVPLENIHILSDKGTEKYTSGRLNTGAHSNAQKSIIVDRKKSNCQFSLVLFHEFIHLKSYSALQVIPEGKIETYRSGISIMSRDGKVVYLKNIEEAIVGYLTQKFYDSVLKTSDFYREETDNLVVNKFSISRQSELIQLNKIADLVYEKNQDQFKNKNEVINLFLDAQINGKLIKLSKLVKSTFGIQSLKILDFKKIN